MQPERENFEKQWQEAFDDAYIFPPARVWLNVEKSLPQPTRKAQPLWWYYAAAGMLAALLVGGLGWQLGYQESQKSMVLDKAERQKAGDSQVSDNQNFIVKENDKTPSQEVAKVSANNVGEERTTHETRISQPTKLSITGVLPTTVEKEGVMASKRTDLNPQQASETEEITANTPNVLVLKTAETNTTEISSTLYNLLKNKGLHLSKAKLRSPRVSYYFAPKIEPTKPTIPKKKWIGATLAALAFDPVLNLKNSSLASANLSAYSQENNTMSSQAAASFNFEVRGGRSLSKHWLTEAGVSYVRGNSTLNNTAYFINRATSSKSNVLSGYFENADIAQNKMAGSLTSAPSATDPTSLLVPSYGTVRQVNNYHFVSVPLKIGYALFPEKKVQVALMTGLSGDIFLKNTIEANGSLNAATYTNADGVYRPLNISGQVGIRSSVKLANHWLLTIDGQFRKMMNDLIENTPSVQSSPQSISVGFGANYQF